MDTQAVSLETQALIEASKILYAAKRELVYEPDPLFVFVHHAQRYVDALLSDHLFPRQAK